ncbi:MAG: A/G-specific adenine glycosylase [Phycisphaerales bacterium]
MLQQTQVTRVVEYFGRFMARFPTVRALAAAEEGEVLALWAGLGYYRRARHLHQAAREIVLRFGGEVPGSVAALRTLPGVGPYTAGAIASIVFGERAAIVDGNVQRVLALLEARRGVVQADWTWARAESLVRAAESPGAFNEGLMELGATVCLPAPGEPRCGECPLRGVCRARRAGLQGTIPAPRQRKEKGRVFALSVVVVNGRGEVLLRRRGPEKMWAGMLECPTVERGARFATGREVEKATGLRAGAVVGEFEFQTTHREFRFRVVRGERTGAGAGDEWVTEAALAAEALSSAQRRVVAMGLGGKAKNGKRRRRVGSAARNG